MIELFMKISIIIKKKKGGNPLNENDIIDIPLTDDKKRIRKVLHLALGMAETLLKNGGEIFRVEETIEHVCAYFKVEHVDFFILSNGIFLTAESEDMQVFAKVRHVPLSSTHLGIVTEVNNLSREISAGKLELEEAFLKLQEIKKLPPKRSYFRILAAGFGSACFCYLLGGSFWDSVLTGPIGTLVYIFVIFAEKFNLSKMITNITGGALITLFAIIITRLGLPVDISRNRMIIGAMMTLTPGVAFTNAIRDLANSDFLSGTVRIIDALLVFVYMAIGAGCTLSLCSRILGGFIK